jgi:hypothetical protein
MLFVCDESNTQQRPTTTEQSLPTLCHQRPIISHQRTTVRTQPDHCSAGAGYLSVLQAVATVGEERERETVERETIERQREDSLSLSTVKRVGGCKLQRTQPQPQLTPDAKGRINKITPKSPNHLILYLTRRGSTPLAIGPTHGGRCASCAFVAMVSACGSHRGRRGRAAPATTVSII